MKTALFIQSFPGGNAAVKRNFPYYKKSGFDLFAVNTKGGGCEWPKPIPMLDIGVNSYISGDNLPRRLVDTFDVFLKEPRFGEYTHAMVIEYDGIFLRPPDQTEIEVAGHRAGHKAWTMKAEHFYHCPWWLSKASAATFVLKGNELIAAGDYEFGHPDFFFGYVFQCLGIPILDLAGTYSRNTVESKEQCQEIRNLKPWFVHGVKSEHILREITQ